MLIRSLRMKWYRIIPCFGFLFFWRESRTTPFWRRAHQHWGLILVYNFYCAWGLHPRFPIDLHWQRLASPDNHRGALSQPPPSTFQACVYLPHLHGSFQANHLQQLITQILTCKLQLFSICECGPFFRSFFSILRWLRLFLDSPQRLDPPCMLGIFKIAIPSREMFIKSICTPSHSISTDSCSFLQVAEKVSDVPNSKYQNLFFILLLNFSGCFSLMMWNLWAMEASFAGSPGVQRRRSKRPLEQKSKNRSIEGM